MLWLLSLFVQNFCDLLWRLERDRSMYSHERVRMEMYEKLCTDFRALSYEYPMTRATSAHKQIPCSEKWLPFVSGIEHAPFRR